MLTFRVVLFFKIWKHFDEEDFLTLKPTNFSDAFVKLGQHLQSVVDESEDYL